MGKVLIGIVTCDRHKKHLPRFFGCVENLRGSKDVLVVDNSETNEYSKYLTRAWPSAMVVRTPFHPWVGKRITDGRNVVLAYAKKNPKYSHVLFIDSDVFMRSDDLLAMCDLDKDIVTKPYIILTFDKSLPVLCIEISPKKFLGTCMIGTFPLKVWATGMGCTLIKRRVFESISFRNDKRISTTREDIFFCVDANKAGFEVWADLRRLVQHENMGWGYWIKKQKGKSGAELMKGGNDEN